ncbi:unnamed protein product [Lota lota]
MRRPGFVVTFSGSSLVASETLVDGEQSVWSPAFECPSCPPVSRMLHSSSSFSQDHASQGNIRPGGLLLPPFLGGSQ